MADQGIVALLFTDLVGSTSMYDRIGDEQAEAVRRAHFAGLRHTLTAHGGEEVKNLGDGLMVTFSSAVAAVEAAIAMQRAATGGPSPPEAGTSTEVRVGIHAGEPLRDEGDFFGVSVNTAKRLCDVAEPGQILASDLIRALVSPRLRTGLRPVGDLQLKGIDEPVSAYEVEWVPPPQATTIPPALAVGNDVPFVGRGEDLLRLTKIWQGVAAGGHAVVLVAGEPGIGKTRLVTELARRASAHGALVMAGRCDAELSTPLGPFADAVRTAARTLPADVRRALTEPDLEPLHRISGAEVTMHETGRATLFGAVVTALHEVREQGPVLFVLDDLHWADDTSLLLLRQVLRDAPPRVLVVITYRDTDLGRTHPLAAFLADLRRAGNVERLALRGLTADSVHELLRGRPDPAGEGALTAVAARITEDTEGNPFFIHEVIRHLVEHRRLEDDGAGGWRVIGPVDTLEVPEGIREVIGRRLSRLSDRCNEVLAVASVIGRHFPARLLAEVTDVALDETLDAIDEALVAKVVEEDPSSLAAFAFSHALVREALYREITTVRRLRLHLRIGNALRTAGGTPAEIAHHLLEAGPVGSTVAAAEAAIAAAADARSRLAAFEDAVGICRRGLAVLGDDDLGLRCDLLNLLGDSLMCIGDPGGVASVDEALELARRLEDPERMTRSVTFGLRSGVPLASTAYAAAAREAAALLPATPSVARARLRAVISMSGGWTPQHAVFAVDRDEVLAEARASGDAEAMAYAALAVADRDLAVGDPAAAQKVLDETIVVVEPAAPEAVLPFGSRFVSIALQSMDRDAAEVAAESVRIFGERYWALPWGHKLPRGALALLDGRLDEANALALELFGSPGGVEQAQALLATTALERGEGAQVLPVLEAQAAANDTGSWAVALALFLVDVGRAAEAPRWLERFEAPAEGDRSGPVGLAVAAEAAAAVGDGGVARMVRPHLDRFRGQALVSGSFLCLGSADRYRALCAVAEGDLDEAITAFDAAATGNRRLRSALYLAHTLIDRAAAHRRRGGDGDEAAAASDLDEASAIASRLELPRVGRRVREATAADGDRTRRGRPGGRAASAYD